MYGTAYGTNTITAVSEAILRAALRDLSLLRVSFASEQLIVEGFFCEEG